MRTRTTAIYDNMVVLDMDGEAIFRCGKKRARWYLGNGLAVKVGPKAIQLNFRTNGPGKKGDEYYLQAKANRCVVCGSDDQPHLTSHHVMPRCYRRHLPLH